MTKIIKSITIDYEVSEAIKTKAKEEKAEEEKRKLRGEHVTPGWGNQIRNYVLHPYKLVKDVRTNIESTNPEAVLNGELDEFIDAEIRL